jgi:benzodiazapine receptor
VKKAVSLAAFIALVAGGGLLIGFLTAPGEWYAQLAKPSFNPPNWLFAPVWTVLYILIAITGWVTWRRDPNGLPMRIWWGQLVANFLWSPVFFWAHLIGTAFLIILGLLVLILAFIAVLWSHDRLAAMLFLPYAAWVGFASILNGAIFFLN